jgi:hypothetical protein
MESNSRSGRKEGSGYIHDQQSPFDIHSPRTDDVP